MHYHDSADFKYAKDLSAAAPSAVEGFGAFDKAVFHGAGELDAKTKELIAVGVAATTQCPYCIDVHVTGAKKAGASKAEVAEAVMVASALRAGGAYTHGFLAMKAYEKGEPS